MTASKYDRAETLAVLDAFVRLPPEQRRAVWVAMPPPARRALFEEWWWQARRGQIEPEACDDGSLWRIWSIVAGRGFGKTRAGAEWVWAKAREHRDARIALVGPTLDEVARVMVEGESGLLAIARSGEHPRWIASRGLLLFPSGAQAHAFSAERPDKLRGPQHHYAWCDELAIWRNADAAWDNLMMGLRLGTQPQTIVTTTPRPVPLLKRILALPRSIRTEGRTADNPDNAPDFIAAMEEMYAGTRLARQELEGLILEEFEGALWSRELIEKARTPSPISGEGRLDEGERGEGMRYERDRQHALTLPPGSAGRVPPCGATEVPSGGRNQSPHPARGEGYQRIVIGLDPPASTNGDSCGIIVCGKDSDGVAYVLADLTAAGLSPEAWARRVAETARQYGASRIVAEKNQGGDMIASVLRAVDADLPVNLVPATKSKAARAEPIALRFETGRARLAGSLPELEDQMCALTWSGYQGPGSPDRLDAMVWAMTELFGKEQAEPRIRRL